MLSTLQALALLLDFAQVLPPVVEMLLQTLNLCVHLYVLNGA